MASVLVVEDNADLREMYAEILLGLGGHSTKAVETARDALAALAAERPDVVLLDLGIVGGIDDVVAELRKGPPAALILASGARDLAEKAAALGAAYLTKPFGPDVLLAAVDRAVKGG